MIRNYLAVALRSLRAEKSYAVVNIFGLAIGLAICLLVMAYIVDEWSFDRFHEGRDRLFRLLQVVTEPGQQLYAGTPFPVRPMLLDNVPNLEAVAQLTGSDDAIIGVGGKNFRDQVCFADPEFFTVFSFKLLSGNRATALSDRSSIVLTASSAQRLFGSTDIVGQSLTVTIAGRQHSYVVSAVIEDTPANSSITYASILRCEEFGKYFDWQLGWNLTCAETFIRLRPGVRPQEAEADIQAAANIVPRRAGSDRDWVYTLQPLDQIHLSPEIESDARTTAPANFYLLGGIGLIVLILACINFTTLAIGRSQRRIREIGVRRVLGARDAQLYGQLLAEALVVSILALLLALALAELALPMFNALAGKSISSVLLTNGLWTLAIIALVILTALLAGGYPALVLTRASAVQAVRGRAQLLSGGFATRLLVTLQFTLSAVLIVISLTMSRQLEYLHHAPVGFDREQLVMLDLRGVNGDDRLAIIERLRASLTPSAGVLSVSASGTSFTGGGVRNGLPYGPDSTLFTVFLNTVDHEYLSTMNLELLKGTPFRAGMRHSRDQVIVNETFAKTLGWEDPLGKAVPGFDNSEIVGVVRDYHIRSLSEPIEPIALLHVQSGNEWSGAIRFAFVRIRPEQIAVTMKNIQEAWLRIAPALPFSYEFMDEHIEAQYRRFDRWAGIVRSAAALAVIVACFGVFGLTALAVARRRKEIGVRKVLGAKSFQLVTLLNRDFLILVAAANLIAWPLAYFAVGHWLAGFAYRVGFSVWPFALGLTLLLTIVLATASVQSLRAALTNPTEVLRTE